MAEGHVIADRLDSWKEIASYINRSVRTVIRWEAQKGLPVHRIPGGERHSVFAFRHEIDAWMQQGERPPEPAPADVWASESESPIVSSAGEAIPFENSRPEAAPRLRGFRAVWLGRAGIILLGTAVSAYAVFRFVSPRTPILGEESQLTDDGAPKMGLATDGANLYFGDWKGGRIVLSAVSVHGGPVREIPTPFVQADPVGVSSDGRFVLTLAGEGQEEERQLWLVPTAGGQPRRIGNVLCHFAAESPDGHWIAYASGNAIYLTEDQGKSVQLLQGFSSTPWELRWSMDGRRLLFRLWDRGTSNSALWELELTAGAKRAVTDLAPLSPVTDPFSSVSPLIDRADDAFVSTEGDRAGISVLESEWPTLRRHFVLTPVAANLISAADLAVDPRAQVLYFRRDQHGQFEVGWFDRQSRQFKPFLPGVSARDVDFSRDGLRIAYVRDADRSLWVANSDGSSARRIDTPAMDNLELPRWSPDGRTLAFTAKGVNTPYRIFVVPAAGGAIREASRGSDNQGAPTWSPDGRRLVYGRVLCQEEGNCSIQQIDLATGTQTTQPGSEGLSTARWSPDGRYVAALRCDTREVFLLDMRTHAWRKLTRGVNGNDLAWSSDSRALYASNPSGDRPQVVRIAVPEGKTEPAVDLSEFSKLSGRVDTWFTITPDNSILFLRIVDSGEIYALHYAER